MQTILLSGLPGRMAREVVLAAGDASAGQFRFHPQALSGRSREDYSISGDHFELIDPAARSRVKVPPGAIAVDFSQPDAALDNIEWFVRQEVPFICGTTGFDAAQARRIVAAGRVPAVIAPNMAVPIVLIQAAIRHIAATYPHALGGYLFSLRESHQEGKKDTSGTAKALVPEFARLGLPARTENIIMVRDPAAQARELGVPREHLAGHAYHFYKAESRDHTVALELSHCVHGRRVYAEGALTAVRFLAAKMTAKPGGVVYSMEDVLRG